MIKKIFVLLLLLIFSQTARAQSLYTTVTPSVKMINGAIPDTTGNVTVDNGFIPGFTRYSPGTLANLYATAPCDASRVAGYAVVTDLFNGAASTNEVMRCTMSAAMYYWRPQRTDFVITKTMTGGTATIYCGIDAPTILASGTLLSNQTMTLSTSNCWPGAQFNIANNATIGIFGLTIGGLIGNTTKALGLNARQTFIYDGTAWQLY